MPQPPDHEAILKGLIASLTLCDHMGDVSNDVDLALRRMGVEVEWDDWDELLKALGKLGWRTLNGTSLNDDDDDEKEEAQ